MTASRSVKTQETLEEQAIVDTIRSFVNIQGRDWIRRQQNELLPRVLRLVDEARAAGHKPDVPALLRQVWLERQLPQPALETSE